MKKLATFLGAIAVLAATPLAHANLALTYQIDALAPVTCATAVTLSPDASAVCFSATPTNIGSGIIVNTFGATGDQTNQPTEEFSSTVRIQNTSTNTVTLTLFVSDQNFSIPTAPPNINWTSSLQLTSTTGSGTVGLTSCIDPTNALATSNPFCTGAGAQSLVNTTLGYLAASSVPPDTISTTITSLSAPYSLSQRITLTLGAGSSLNFIASQVLTVVPEPMSITLLGGALLLTAGIIRRKRTQRLEA